LSASAINLFGTYEVRARDRKEAAQIRRDAKALEAAGAFAIVLEKIPAQLARGISTSVRIPTIGIGAGPHCDGQVLVVYDMLGMTEEFRPRFVRRYAELAESMRDAFSRYIEDVKGKRFPGAKESY
jgi:3-methyl-2-oxobutanoate hydroxymethyltransferase